MIRYRKRKIFELRTVKPVYGGRALKRTPDKSGHLPKGNKRLGPKIAVY